MNFNALSGSCLLFNCWALVTVMLESMKYPLSCKFSEGTWALGLLFDSGVVKAVFMNEVYSIDPLFCYVDQYR